jgi:hypothetical protein
MSWDHDCRLAGLPELCMLGPADIFPALALKSRNDLGCIGFVLHGTILAQIYAH